jgi:Trypsin-co-occurring domain 2
MADQQPGIPLADLIDAVRGELEVAALNAVDQKLQFEVQDVQLEVEIATTGTKGAGAGIKVWVVNIGAKASKSDANTQKVTLKLGPVSPDGTKFKVSDVTAKPIRRE